MPDSAEADTRRNSGTSPLVEPQVGLLAQVPIDQDDSYDQIFEQLREAAKRELTTEVQQELTRLIAVTRRCKNIDNSDKCVRELTIALNALLQAKPPNLELAGGSICVIEIQTMRCQGRIS